MQNKPLVSVCIPVYNSKKTFLKSINSILNQSYKNLEIIISDNNSSDGTFELCEKIKKKDKRVKVFRQKTNIDVIENFKFVQSKAKGKFFMWHPSHYFRSKNFVKDNMLSFQDKSVFGSCSKELFFDEYKNKKWVFFSLDRSLYENLKLLIRYFNRSHGIFYALYRNNRSSYIKYMINYIAFDWNFCVSQVLNGKINRVKKSYILIGRGSSTKKNFYKNNIKYKFEILFPYFFFLKNFFTQIIETKKLTKKEKLKINLFCMVYVLKKNLKFYLENFKTLFV